MHSYFLSYPVFCAGSDGHGLLITGGGGGGKAYGVINYLQAHVVVGGHEVSMETVATMDTGADAPTALSFCPAQGGVWACVLGANCLLFKFNDATLSMETLYRFKCEISGSDLEMANCVKLSVSSGSLVCITGGENKIVRVWQIEQQSGAGTKIIGATLKHEFTKHGSEIVDADIVGDLLASSGKDGSVYLFRLSSGAANSQIRPLPLDTKTSTHLSIRSSFIVNEGKSVVVLCHHPRGPSYLFLYNIQSPQVPIYYVCVSKTQITPSMGISECKTKVVVALAGGEKNIYKISHTNIKLILQSNKHCHEMPPGDTLFLNSDENFVVSASPDFSLNFFDPRFQSRSGLLWAALIVLILCIIACIYYPEAVNSVIAFKNEL